MLFPCITIRKAPDGGIKLLELFTINHNGTFYLYFSFFITLCCLFSSYMYLAMAAFRTQSGDGVSIELSIFFEIMFCVDIIVNSCLSYEKEDSQSEETEWNMSKTAYRYLSTSFARDFIPVIPF